MCHNTRPIFDGYADDYKHAKRIACCWHSGMFLYVDIGIDSDGNLHLQEQNDGETSCTIAASDLPALCDWLKDRIIDCVDKLPAARVDKLELQQLPGYCGVATAAIDEDGDVIFKADYTGPGPYVTVVRSGIIELLDYVAKRLEDK